MHDCNRGNEPLTKHNADTEAQRFEKVGKIPCLGLQDLQTAKYSLNVRKLKEYKIPGYFVFHNANANSHSCRVKVGRQQMGTESGSSPFL